MCPFPIIIISIYCKPSLQIDRNRRKKNNWIIYFVRFHLINVLQYFIFVLKITKMKKKRSTWRMNEANSIRMWWLISVISLSQIMMFIASHKTFYHHSNISTIINYNISNYWATIRQPLRLHSNHFIVLDLRIISIVAPLIPIIDHQFIQSSTIKPNSIPKH